MTLAPGDVLTLYTDGINEAMNQSRPTLRLSSAGKSKICDADCRDRKRLGKAILEDVKKLPYARDPQSDDRCLICFGRRDVMTGAQNSKPNRGRAMGFYTNCRFYRPRTPPLRVRCARSRRVRRTGYRS